MDIFCKKCGNAHAEEICCKESDNIDKPPLCDALPLSTGLGKITEKDISDIKYKTAKIKSIIEQYDRIVARFGFDSSGDDIAFQDLMLYRIKDLLKDHPSER